MSHEHASFLTAVIVVSIMVIAKVGANVIASRYPENPKAQALAVIF